MFYNLLMNTLLLNNLDPEPKDEENNDSSGGIDYDDHQTFGVPC